MNENERKNTIKITIEGTTKEIADLVTELQDRQINLRVLNIVSGTVKHS